MSLPPRWVRRLLLWPLPLLLLWVYLASVPLLLVIAAIASYRLPGSLRAVRSLGLLTVYVVVECCVLVALLGLWVATGFGWRLDAPWSQQAHHRVLRWALRVLVAAGRRLFSLTIDVAGTVRAGDDPVPATTIERIRDGGLVVMSRHAGPADSILLMHELTSRFHRRPRIVLKAALQWDPAFDALLNRIPTRFVGGARGTTVDAVRELAAGMGPGDAFVIFPEGGNFTQARRERSIAWFEEHGRQEEADRARAMQRVLAPRTGGALAALDGSPDSAAVFVAHTGLDHIDGLGDLWRAIPTDKVLEMGYVAIPPEALPADEEGRVELLWRAWEQIDGWIADRSA